MVTARATAFKRRAQVIDLIKAYSQVLFGGDVPHYLLVPAKVIEMMPADLRHKFDGLNQPVCRVHHGLYGLTRCGGDFIKGFFGWLLAVGWLQTPEEPAFMVYWHVGGDAALIRKALDAKRWIDKELNP